MPDALMLSLVMSYMLTLLVVLGMVAALLQDRRALVADLKRFGKPGSDEPGNG